MKKILMGITLLTLAACSTDIKGMAEEQAVENIKSNIEMNPDATDGDIKEAMQNACNLFDDLGVGMVALTMIGEYTEREAKLFLTNAATVYCPEYLERVQDIGG